MNWKISAPVALALSILAGGAQAVIIDFKSLADGSLGESAWSTLMFRVDGLHTTVASEAFVSITASNGGSSYAYLDANNAGLGVCGSLFNASSANSANPNSGTNLCNPASDDNVSYHGGTPESLRFVFDTSVTIEKIWLNNNHDGDRSLFNDWVTIDSTPRQITSAPDPLSGDHEIVMDLFLNAGMFFDIGFFAPETQVCWNDNGGTNGDGGFGAAGNYNLCEFYVSKIEFSSTLAEPSTVVLLGLGLFGIGFIRGRG